MWTTNAGRRGGWCHLRDEGVVEGFPPQVLRPLAQVGAARPVEDVRKLPHDVERLLGGGRLVAVDRHVAGLADVLRLQVT